MVEDQSEGQRPASKFEIHEEDSESRPANSYNNIKEVCKPIRYNFEKRRNVIEEGLAKTTDGERPNNWNQQQPRSVISKEQPSKENYNSYSNREKPKSVVSKYPGNKPNNYGRENDVSNPTYQQDRRHVPNFDHQSTSKPYNFNQNRDHSHENKNWRDKSANNFSHTSQQRDPKNSGYEVKICVTRRETVVLLHQSITEGPTITREEVMTTLIEDLIEAELKRGTNLTEGSFLTKTGARISITHLQNCLKCTPLTTATTFGNTVAHIISIQMERKTFHKTLRTGIRIFTITVTLNTMIIIEPSTDHPIRTSSLVGLPIPILIIDRINSTQILTNFKVPLLPTTKARIKTGKKIRGVSHSRKIQAIIIKATVTPQTAKEIRKILRSDPTTLDKIQIKPILQEEISRKTMTGREKAMVLEVILHSRKILLKRRGSERGRSTIASSSKSGTRKCLRRK